MKHEWKHVVTTDWKFHIEHSIDDVYQVTFGNGNSQVVLFQGTKQECEFFKESKEQEL